MSKLKDPLVDMRGALILVLAYLQQQQCQEESQLPRALALLDLSSILDGLKVQEHHLPIFSNPAWSVHFSHGELFLVPTHSNYFHG